MSMISYFDFFVSSLINMLMYTYIVHKVFKANTIKNKKKVIFFILLASTFISFVNTFNNEKFKIILTFPFVIIMIKNIFCQTYNKTIIYCIFSTLYMFASEVIIGLIFSILPYDYTYISNHILGSTIGTILVMIPTMLLTKIVKLEAKLNNININKTDYLILLIIIILAIGALTYKISTNTGNLINIIINLSISITFFIIIFMYYKENEKSQELSKNYNDLFEYLEKYEKELVEKRKIIHDYKNQLIIINGYIDNKTKLKEYVNELISEQKSIKENSIIKNIDRLPKGLKGLIYYKFSHIDSKIIVNLNVSKNMKAFDKISPKLNKQVLKIIGIMIDNAIEAVQQEKEKNIDINFINENNNFKVILNNTCTKRVNLDNIMNSGVSTKGKNRGYGLSLVKDILKEEKNINLEIKLENNVFKAELKLDLN